MDRQKLLEEKHHLERCCFSLECGDELLYSNGNGNLDMFKGWVKRITEINEVLNG